MTANPVDLARALLTLHQNNLGGFDNYCRYVVESSRPETAVAALLMLKNAYILSEENFKCIENDSDPIAKAQALIAKPQASEDTLYTVKPGVKQVRFFDGTAPRDENATTTGDAVPRKEFSA